MNAICIKMIPKMEKIISASYVTATEYSPEHSFENKRKYRIRVFIKLSTRLTAKASV